MCFPSVNRYGPNSFVPGLNGCSYTPGLIKHQSRGGYQQRPQGEGGYPNCDALCPHGRNLTDAEAKNIAALGGIVGISFTPGHLNSSGTADISDIVAHAKHYLSLGLENSLSIGADFDGIVNLPRGIINEKNIVDVERAMKEAGIPAEIVEKIFWHNAENFIKRNM